ncbi:MAG: tetratricopeptide repeat protein [Acidobacteria bacterium ACB1]|nr:Beta-barrel assembly-enhancing protease [Pyrinomonadaceae bacterium]MCE7962357.1 tetratricopeptide repeat protein [Acidobacteria bacterium ACB1]RIJ96281.1 MAG: hypothetical protein DCC44_00780 [Acidobacteriota bacterium]
MKKLLLLFVLLALGSSTYAQKAVIPKTARDYFNEGLSLLAAEKPEEALAAFYESAKLKPDQATTHFNIGYTLLILKRPSEAVSEYRKALKLDASNAKIHLGLCSGLAALKKFDEAASECREAVRLDPKSENAWSLLLLVLQQSKVADGDIETAVLAALNAFRNSEAVLNAATAFYLRTSQLSIAAEMLERLVQLRPDAASYHARLAVVYFLIARDDRAVAEAQKARDIDPADVYLQYFMGRLFLKLGQNKDAVAAFEKVVGTNVDIPKARYYLAISEALLGRTQKAIEDLKIQVSLYPDIAAYQYELGDKLNSVARYEEAIEPLRKAVELDHDDLAAHASLGLALFESTKFLEARLVLDETNRRWPGNPVILQYLKVAAARERFLPQLDAMKEAAKASPSDVNLRITIVEGLIFSRRIAETDPFVKEIWQLGLTDLRQYFRLAAAYGTAGEGARAAEVFKRSLGLKESAMAYFGIGRFHADNGRVAEASQAFEKALALDPDFLPALEVYGGLCRDNGRRRDAYEMYKRVVAQRTTNISALANAGVLAAELGDMDAAKNYVVLLQQVEPKMAKTLAQFIQSRLWR